MYTIIIVLSKGCSRPVINPNIIYYPTEDYAIYRYNKARARVLLKNGSIILYQPIRQEVG